MGISEEGSEDKSQSRLVKTTRHLLVVPKLKAIVF